MQLNLKSQHRHQLVATLSCVTQHVVTKTLQTRKTAGHRDDILFLSSVQNEQAINQHFVLTVKHDSMEMTSPDNHSITLIGTFPE